MRPKYIPESFFQTSLQNCANFCLNKIIHEVLPYPGHNFQLDRRIALMPSDRRRADHISCRIHYKKLTKGEGISRATITSQSDRLLNPIRQFHFSNAEKLGLIIVEAISQISCSLNSSIVLLNRLKC